MFRLNNTNSFMKRCSTIIVLISLGVVLTGCATADTGTSETIPVVTTPSTETAESVESGTPTESASGLSIAIFPFGGLWTGDQSQAIAVQMSEVAAATIEKDARFVLRYSYYANADDNELSISGTERVWEGVRPNNYLNESTLYSLGKRYNLDAVLVYKVELGPWRHSDFAWVNVECRVFDIEKRGRVNSQGDLDLAKELTEDCLSKSNAERAT
jgi:hypothetical protein